MESQREHIRLLIRRYRSGSASEGEVRQLLSYLQSGEDTDYIESLINEDLLDTDIPETMAESVKMEKKMDELFVQIKKRQSPPSRYTKQYLRYEAPSVFVDHGLYDV